MYKYLIFDLDDTLLDFKKGEHEGLVRVLTNYGVIDVENALSVYKGINRGLWQRYEQGEITKVDIQQTRFPELLNTLGIIGDGIEMERAYRNELNHNNHVIPGAESLLQALRKTDSVLIAGTNGETQTQKMRLMGTGFGKFFDQVYISDELGYAKPDPTFYEPIFSANPEMTKENTAMIGDGIPSDMRGGNAVGIDTIWVNLNESVLPENVSVTHEVKSLEHLGALLQRTVQ